MSKVTLESWKVHTPNLIAEMVEGSGAGTATRIPAMVLMRLLAQVGEEAIRINDPKLNELMCRLTIYSMADPESPDYDPKALQEVKRLAHRAPQ